MRSNGTRGDKGIGLVDLPARHNLGKRFKPIGNGGVAGSDGTGVPGVSGNVVKRKAFAGFIEIAEESKRARISLIGGETCPVSSLSVIGSDANALEIAVGEAVLSGGETLFGGGAKPLGSFVVVDGSGVAEIIAEIIEGAEIELSGRIAMQSGSTIPAKGSG